MINQKHSWEWYIIHNTDNITNNYVVSYVPMMFFISILLSILVVISKNPIISVLYLIGLFFNIACYLILLGMNFIGISYLLVYVGAVSILFLFILMLINIRISELTTETTNSIFLTLIVSILFIYSLNKTMYVITNLNIIEDLNNILLVTSNLWDGYVSETIHITSIGNVLYVSYSIWLFITSIILLVAMVGSIIITLSK